MLSEAMLGILEHGLCLQMFGSIILIAVSTVLPRTDVKLTGLEFPGFPPGAILKNWSYIGQLPVLNYRGQK